MLLGGNSMMHIQLAAMRDVYEPGGATLTIQLQFITDLSQ